MTLLAVPAFAGRWLGYDIRNRERGAGIEAIAGLSVVGAVAFAMLRRRTRR